MLSQVDAAKQSWSNKNTSLDEWLSERKKLIIQYCELAGLPPHDKESDTLPNAEDIRIFCETLLDYVCAGHFEMYDKVASRSDSADERQTIENEIYPKISPSTEHALAFNDLFAEASSDQDLKDFDAQLSNLGEHLEQRFELEDKLLSTINSQHEATK